MLWLWELRDVGVIGVGLLVSILALTQTGIFIPLVLTAVYAFLSIRFDGTSILDFIRYAIAYYPILLVSGCLAGTFTGLCAQSVLAGLRRAGALGAKTSTQESNF